MNVKTERRDGGKTQTAQAALCALLLFLVTTACGQDQAVQELKRLHDDLCQPQRVVSTEQAQAAQAQLREWNLSPDALGAQERGWLLQTEVYVALALGDAGQAAEKLAQLRSAAPDARETLEATYAVAVARGDAEAGQEALKKLADVVPAEERRVLAQRRRWVKKLGTEAPSIELAAEGGTKLSAQDRYGVVLVLDFWNTRDVSKAYAQALKDLHEKYRSDLRVQFVGVNTDGKSSVEDARRFAREAGYAWPQVYEERAADAPITHKAFGAGAPPWTVVIDGNGRIRAVGAVTEPPFQYALRAAMTEAAAKAATSKSGDQASDQPPSQGAPGDSTGGAAGGTGGDKGKPQVSPGKGDLPDNPEAEALLRRARLYLKTGKKTEAKRLLKEIIEKYPGTRQAKDAEERLHDLPP